MDMNPLLHPTTGKTFRGHRRLGVYDFEDIMGVLAQNYQRPNGDPHRAAGLLLGGHVVTVTGLKLRTFIHHYLKGDCSCSDKDCGIKPAYFALERANTNTKLKNKTAYLSLYGIDKHGNEVEFTHDHTLARCFGGANSLVNTTVMCKTCNNLKSRIEAKMHNKTLVMLKTFLDETGGGDTHPQFLLERLRKKEYNAISSEVLDLERIDVMGLDKGLEAITSSDPVLKWGDKKIRTDGLRLRVFSHNKEPHCQNPQCQMRATHFAVERVRGKHEDENTGFYLNMYGTNDKGEEVMFHHHHLLKAGQDGVPDGMDVIALCRDCKDKNFEMDVVQYSNTLLDTYKGVSQRELDVLLEKKQTLEGQALGENGGSSKKLKQRQDIDELVSFLMGYFKKDSKEALIAFCEEQAQKEEYESGHIKNDFSLLLKKELGLSNQAARFMHTQQSLLGVGDKKNHVFHQIVDGVSLWQSWEHRLCQHYGLDKPQLYSMFETQSENLTRKPRTNSWMRFYMKETGKSNLFAHVFLRHVGHTLQEGPYKLTALPKNFTKDGVKPAPLVGKTISLSFTAKQKLPSKLSNSERQQNLMHMFLKALAKNDNLSVSEYWGKSVAYSKRHNFSKQEEFEKIDQRFKDCLASLGLKTQDGLLFFEKCALVFLWGPLVCEDNISRHDRRGVFEKACDILGDEAIPLVLGKDKLVLWKEQHHQKDIPEPEPTNTASGLMEALRKKANGLFTVFKPKTSP